MVYPNFGICTEVYRPINDGDLEMLSLLPTPVDVMASQEEQIPPAQQLIDLTNDLDKSNGDDEPMLIDSTDVELEHNGRLLQEEQIPPAPQLIDLTNDWDKSRDEESILINLANVEPMVIDLTNVERDDDPLLMIDASIPRNDSIRDEYDILLYFIRDEYDVSL